MRMSLYLIAIYRVLERSSPLFNWFLMVEVNNWLLDGINQNLVFRGGVSLYIGIAPVKNYLEMPLGWAMTLI